jgi:hypothetical protein
MPIRLRPRIEPFEQAILETWRFPRIEKRDPLTLNSFGQFTK